MAPFNRGPGTVQTTVPGQTRRKRTGGPTWAAAHGGTYSVNPSTAATSSTETRWKPNMLASSRTAATW